MNKTERKRKRISVNSDRITQPMTDPCRILIPSPDANSRGAKKINKYLSQSPLGSFPGMMTAKNKSPVPISGTPLIYPQSSQVQFVNPSAILPNSDFHTLIQPSKIPNVAKCVQTELSSQFIGELVRWRLRAIVNVNNFIFIFRSPLALPY